MTANTASCLCGEVSFTAEKIDHNIHACHCTMCTKWGGGPFLAVDCHDLSIQNEGSVERFDSSDWGQRAFCKKCGTHLFYYLKPYNVYSVPAPLFEDQSPFTMDKQIFIDEKPKYYCFSNQTKTMTAKEVFESYTS